MKTFPEGFVWGCSTSAYQIEGAPLADGAGVSNWHRFSHIPGKVHLDQTGDIACDHYNRYREDVAMMADLGMQAYRFSINWARVLPEGTGAVNAPGLDFYSRLVDALLEKGIKPFVTLHHWDMPQALDERGGWLNRDVADWFTDYASVMYAALDDRVESWATLNEPWVIMDGGFMHGALAPGHNSHYEAAIATHNMMRAHASAVRRYREVGKKMIGLVVNLEPKTAATDSQADADAVVRADAYMNKHYLDPALLGEYPDDLKKVFGDAWLPIFDEEAKSLAEPVDFIGVNYYTRSVTADAPEAWPTQSTGVRQPMATYTETGWEVYPKAFTDILVWVKDRYDNPPVYITENGAAFYDAPVAEEGRVRDPLRQSYYRSHITAVRDAIDQGCDVRGYCLWSLMDNLEWALGYSKRFGMVHVNYETLERTPKDSARYYTQVVRTNGAILDAPLDSVALDGAH